MDRIKELVKEHISPELKSHGFKKRAHKWKRERDGFVDVVVVRSSRWNSSNDESCDIEYGVCAPELYSLIWSRDLDDFPIEANAIFKGTSSKHAKLECSNDIEKEGILLRSNLAADILPEFDRFNDYDSLHHHLELIKVIEKSYPLDKIYLSLLKNELGLHSEAKDILLSIINGSNKGWGERSNDVFQKLFKNVL